MLSINELKPGIIFLFENQPFEVVEAKHLHLGRGGAILQTKIKNLITGTTVKKNLKPGDTFNEADVSQETAKYIYSHREEYFFSKIKDPSKRFSLKEEKIGQNKNFLKEGTEVNIIKFKDQIINISLPIKVDLKVIEAPPSFRGNTAQGGTKKVVLETKAEIKVPFFIKEGDIIKVNTKKGEYVERAN